jgi:hypothetical protein
LSLGAIMERAPTLRNRRSELPEWERGGVHGSRAFDASPQLGVCTG